jgi:CrcB protein
MDFDMKMVALIGIGGAIGCILRFLVGVALTKGEFPVGTLFVNVMGSFLLALIFFVLSEGSGVSTDVRAFLFIGFFGGFTTFSTFTLETVGMLLDDRVVQAVGNILLNVGLCLGGALLAKAIAPCLVSWAPTL